MNDVFAERVKNKSSEKRKKPGPAGIRTLVRRTYHYFTWTHARGAEDKLHKQHCAQALNFATFAGPVVTCSEIQRPLNFTISPGHGY